MRTHWRLLIVASLLSIAPALILAQNKILIRPDLKDPDSLSLWTLDGTGSWQIADGKLVLSKAGVPSGPIRRPSALAVLKSNSLCSVRVDVELRSNVDTSVIHRDLDIAFDYQSPQRFYYIHLAGTTDKVHNGIFIVNNTDRRRIDSGKADPQLKDKQWHHVSVTRNDHDGTISVFVDAVPVLAATDTTFSCGRVGFGSFDDIGVFRNILIAGCSQ